MYNMSVWVDEYVCTEHDTRHVHIVMKMREKCILINQKTLKRIMNGIERELLNANNSQADNVNEIFLDYIIYH